MLLGKVLSPLTPCLQSRLSYTMLTGIQYLPRGILPIFRDSIDLFGRNLYPLFCPVTCFLINGVELPSARNHDTFIVDRSCAGEAGVYFRLIRLQNLVMRHAH